MSATHNTKERPQLNPIEVVIREPRRKLVDLIIPFLVAAVVLPLKAWAVMAALPTVAAIFSIEAHPTFGQSLTLVIIVAVVLPIRRIGALGPEDTNRFRKEAK